MWSLCVVVVFFFVVCFVFQAEDGIRDLVRSRGLGDVYKRQPRDLKVLEKIAELNKANPLPTGHARGMAMFRSFETMGAALVEITKTNDVIKIVKAVSYTHLTLPTSDLV